MLDQEHVKQFPASLYAGLVGLVDRKGS